MACESSFGRNHFVAQACVGKGATHHHFVIAAARSIRIEISGLYTVGHQVFSGIADVVKKFSAGRQISVRVTGSKNAEFKAIVRIDTPQEALYYANGGILQYVLRQLIAGS